MARRPGAFHRNHGKRIRLSEEGTVAHRVKTCVDGIVFTEQPIPLGSVFQVKLLEKDKGWSGCFELGFTTLCPDNTAVPSDASPFWESADHWTLCGNTVRHNRQERSVDLEIWTLGVGQSVGCMVNEEGELRYFLDSVDQGVAWNGVPTDKPLWGVADVYGPAKKIKSEFYFAPRAAVVKLPRYQQQLSEETEEKRLLQQQLRAQTALLDRLQNDNVRLQEERKTVQNEFSFLRQDLVTLQQEKAKIAEEKRAVQSENSSLRRRIMTLQQQLSQEAEERAVAAEEKVALQKCSNLQQEVSTLRQEIVAFRQERATATEERQMMIDSHSQEQQELRSQIQQMKSRVQELQRQLETARAQIPTPLQVPSPAEDSWNVPRGEVEILEEIGRGGWGLILKGRFRGQLVAVKKAYREILQQPYTIRQMRREIQIMASVQHPNLVRFVAAVIDERVERREETPLLVVELLDMDLRHAYSAINLGTNTTPIFRDVAYALHYLHEHQEPIIHRDVSAPNVLLETLQGGTYRAKLSDFGSANRVKDSKTAAPGAICYTAPEVFPPADPEVPMPPQTPKIDVFSYGILLAEVINKTMPTTENRSQLFREVKGKWVLMYDLICSCSKPRPSDRPTMASVLNTLSRIPTPRPQQRS